MNVAVLGANWSPCAEPIDQMVVPATGFPSPSVQVKAVPPHSWTSMPRCRLYQACSAGASLALKKMPPMPVTRFIKSPRSGGGECARPCGCRQKEVFVLLLDFFLLLARPQPAERRAGDQGEDDPV